MIIQCIICSDILNQSDNIYFTKCGHLFHYNCLHTWIIRSKTCPQCRETVTAKSMFRVYITVSNQPTGEESAHLQIKLDNAMLQIRQQNQELRAKEELITKFKADLKKNETTLKHFEKKHLSTESSIAALQQQLHYMRAENVNNRYLKQENEMLKNNLMLLEGLQKVFNSTVDEVDQMLEGYTDVRTVATFATALKKALFESESKKTLIRNKLQSTKQELNDERTKYEKMANAFSQKEETCILLRIKYEALKNKLEAIEMITKSSAQENCTPPQEIKQHHPIVNTAKGDETVKENDCNNSIISMIKTIENTASPYLNLRQSSHLLAPLQNSPMNIFTPLKPFKSVKNQSHKVASFTTNQQSSLSIFGPKEPTSTEFTSQNVQGKCNSDISYDGLGGHSKSETFPVASNNSRKLNSCIPKLTSRHKLKRPAGVKDKGEMIKKARGE